MKGLHSIGELDPERRFIMHFPESLEIQSFGSGYGGNALLGKKCHALRIASWQARDEGWLAEHMLIVGVENPQGETHYLACAFPSACGKTNLAMLIPPASMPGWKIWTVGDDIAWLHPGPDGRLWAINPEAGYFGVVPGTNEQTNRHAYEMIRRDTIFTNVALTKDSEPWWEGLERRHARLRLAGPTVRSRQGPRGAPELALHGVREAEPELLAAGGCPGRACRSRRSSSAAADRTLAPLVYQARDWAHGVLVGAGMASETTAAATGDVGVVRRDPMAMKPFAGYNFADYWAHWLSMDQRVKKLPGIFHVNWFRRDAGAASCGRATARTCACSPGSSSAARGRLQGLDTAIGAVPTRDALDFCGLGLDEATIAELLAVDGTAWRQEADEIGKYLESYGDRLPAGLREEVARLKSRLN